MPYAVRRQPRLTDGDGRGSEGAPVEVAVAQHAAAGALEHQIIGALLGKGRGDLLGQEPGEWDRSSYRCASTLRAKWRACSLPAVSL
jgi:hypothetical protein